MIPIFFYYMQAKAKNIENMIVRFLIKYQCKKQMCENSSQDLAFVI